MIDYEARIEGLATAYLEGLPLEGTRLTKLLHSIFHAGYCRGRIDACDERIAATKKAMRELHADEEVMNCLNE